LDYGRLSAIIQINSRCIHSASESEDSWVHIFLVLSAVMSARDHVNGS